MLEFASGNEHHYQVLDRNNGKPIEGARIHFEKSYPNENNLLVNEHLSTGNLGIASYKRQSGLYSNVNATVNFQGDTATFGDYYLYPFRSKEIVQTMNASRRVRFYLPTEVSTDRAR